MKNITKTLTILTILVVLVITTVYISGVDNITGNFVYMRAKIKDFANGVVQYVKLTY